MRNLPQVYWIAKSGPGYQLRRYTKKPARLRCALHMVRDASSMIEIMGGLGSEYRFGGVLYDLPADDFATADPEVPLGVADLPALVDELDSDDLVVQTTRPPLSRAPADAGVEPSGSKLERAVHEPMGRVFCTLASRRAELHPSNVPPLTPPFTRDPAFMKRGAPVCKAIGEVRGPAVPRSDLDCPWKEQDTREEMGWTTGYSAYFPAWRLDGAAKTARLLVTFAFNGTTNLLWSHLLATRLRAKLHELLGQSKPSLLVGEFAFWMPRKDFPRDLSFTDYYECHCAQVDLRT